MKAGTLIILSLFLLPEILFATSVYSQTDDSTNVKSYNNAIQFYIVDEIIVAYKYSLTSNSSLRFLVNASGLFTEKNSDEQIIYDFRYGDVQNREKTDTKSTSHFYELKTQYLYDIEINKILKVYFGGGLLFNYQYAYSENWYERVYSDSSTYSYTYQSIEQSFGIGLSALAGLDCKIYDNIKMFVEYEATGTRSWQTKDNSNRSVSYRDDKFDIDIWTFELKGLRIGLTVNF